MREDLIERIFEPLLRSTSPYILLSLLREKNRKSDRVRSLSTWCCYKNGLDEGEDVRWSTNEEFVTLRFGDGDDPLRLPWDDVLDHLLEGGLLTELVLTSDIEFRMLPEEHGWWEAFPLHPYSAMNVMSEVPRLLAQRRRWRR